MNACHLIGFAISQKYTWEAPQYLKEPFNNRLQLRKMFRVWLSTYFMSGKGVKFSYTVPKGTIAINNPYFTLRSTQFGSEGESTSNTKCTKGTRI